MTSLTEEQVTKLFLGKTSTFPNDLPALPIDQPEGSKIREEFYSRVVHKDSSQLTAYWAKIIFTGDGHLPAILTGDLAVRKAVSGNRNAIGYIDSKFLNHSVKVVLKP